MTSLISTPSASRARFDFSLIAFGLVLIVAAVLRFYDLDLKPLHSDESVNGYFMERLLGRLIYRYHPSDFHGPLLYFANFFPMQILWRNPAWVDESLRFATAIAGIASVASLRLYRPWIGAWGTVVAALLLAVSAPDVYFSRTCIHEVWLALFTLVAGAATLHAISTGAYWAFLGAGAAWALAIATKETVIISLGAFSVGLLLALGRRLGWLGLVAAVLVPLVSGIKTAVTEPQGIRSPDAVLFWKVTVLALIGSLVLGSLSRFAQDADAAPMTRVPLERLVSWLKTRRTELAGALIVAGVVLVLLFSSFFTWPPGLVGIVQAYLPWVQYGVTGRNQGKPPGYFLEMWVWWAPVLLVCLPGVVAGLMRRSRIVILCLTWFGLSLLAYEVIRYKTPWCALQMGMPLFVLAGNSVQQLTAARNPLFKVLGALVVLVLVVPATYEGARATYDANFVRYDDTRIPYVYVQTRAPFMDMAEDLWAFRANRKAAEGENAETKLYGVESKNPIRWYLLTRDWPQRRISFRNQWPEANEDLKLDQNKKSIEEAPIVIVARKWERNTQEIIDYKNYVRRSYVGRPGTFYTMYVRNELAQYLPPERAAGDQRVHLDGGGDPLRSYKPAPPSFFPWVKDNSSMKPGPRARPEQTKAQPQAGNRPEGAPNVDGDAPVREIPPDVLVPPQVPKQPESDETAKKVATDAP